MLNSFNTEIGCFTIRCVGGNFNRISILVAVTLLKFKEPLYVMHDWEFRINIIIEFYCNGMKIEMPFFIAIKTKIRIKYLLSNANFHDAIANCGNTSNCIIYRMRIIVLSFLFLLMQSNSIGISETQKSVRSTIISTTAFFMYIFDESENEWKKKSSVWVAVLLIFKYNLFFTQPHNSWVALWKCIQDVKAHRICDTYSYIHEHIQSHQQHAHICKGRRGERLCYLYVVQSDSCSHPCYTVSQTI